MKLKAHMYAYSEEQPSSPFIGSISLIKKEVTNHYSLIPNNKENNMDLKIKGQTYG